MRGRYTGEGREKGREGGRAKRRKGSGEKREGEREGGKECVLTEAVVFGVVSEEGGEALTLEHDAARGREGGWEGGREGGRSE